MLVLLSLLMLGASPPRDAVEMRSGDWHLLCDNWNACRITGIAPDSRNGRALVLIDRSAVPGSTYRVRIIFQGVREPWRELRLFPGNPRSLPPPLRLEFEPYGVPDIHFLVDRDRSVSRFLGLLAAPGRAVISASGLHVADMPRGDIRALLARIEREQRRHPELPEADDSGPRFDFEFHRVRQRPDRELPPGMHRPCGRVADRGSLGWQLDSAHRMWIVQCLGRSRIFVEIRDGAVQPIGPDLLPGGLPAGVAAFDPEEAMLTLATGREGRTDCGERRSWGWVESEGFVSVRVQSMPMCRGIPSEFWPDRWSARRWRVLG
ncbi:DUF1176 domain-containing protein [Sphingomonas sp. AOB5]|uniref:DUF1176 domain-containing protein n=1 Tax=Sphingomonas sp. AOB5 TaxID=3034017 RepID=UPI0023F84C17|nr:DUF1176 domain-containing protein [Sphingomonas sp. AOB5]MDF7775415.1 DUF1176 domain-containing protein [Sphingomonas sp. AOB5]